MKEILRATLWCLFVALAMNVAFNVAGQALAPGGAADYTWLHIFAAPDTNTQRIRPEQTVIYCSAKPTVLQTAPSQWTITFSTRF